MEIYKKLFAVKSEIGKISKDSSNPFFKSKYFDVNALLENVEPLLHKNKLLLLQPIENNEVVSRIIDMEDENGESVESSIALPELTDPQKLGSAITYYRRYTLQSLLGIQAEDDDANKAAGNTIKTEDTRPWLDDKGFAYLMESGTPEDIEKAFKTRRMKKEYATALKTK